MQNFLILAEASPSEAPAAPQATATPEMAAKEVPAQPLNETTTATGTQAPGSQTPTPTDQKTRTEGQNPMWTMVLMIAVFVVMYFMFIRTPKKQQQQQQEMVRSLQKNDRVRTVGGIIGVVVDVKDEYVTLKIDETTNTKIRVVPGAISKNLAPEAKE